MRLSARVAFGAGEEYWMNGLMMATAARMIFAGRGVQPGVRNLFDAVDRIDFMTELRNAGVQQSELLEPCK